MRQTTGTALAQMMACRLFMEMYLNISSAKRWPFCPGGDESTDFLVNVPDKLNQINVLNHLQNAPCYDLNYPAYFNVDRMSH